MVQLILTLVFSALIFSFMWGPLGAREWVTELLRDEGKELRRQLAEAEDRLAELDAGSEAQADTTIVLRRHYETEAAGLRRRLARLG